MTDETAGDPLRGGGHPTILLVEAHEDSRGWMELVLKAAGYSVICTTSGRQALERLRSLRVTDRAAPCIVILDLMISEGSGWAVRVEQMEDPAIADVPVIVTSADVLALRNVQRLRPLAAFAKPFDPNALLPVIQRACATAQI